MVNAFPVQPADETESDDMNKAGYRIFDNFEQETLSVTQTNANVSYSAEKTSHLIKNIGSNKVYVNFGAAATTSSFQIDPSDFAIFNTAAIQINAICDTGLTSTLRIIGQ